MSTNALPDSAIELTSESTTNASETNPLITIRPALPSFPNEEEFIAEVPKIEGDSVGNSRSSTPFDSNRSQSDTSSDNGSHSQRLSSNAVYVGYLGEEQELISRVKFAPQTDVSRIVPEVRKCNWEHFINRFSEDEPTYAVEALLAGDQLGKEMLEEARKRKNSGYFGAANYESVARVNKMHTDKTRVQRIRIQSPALLEILSKITGDTWSTSTYTFLEPFRYLIHHHEALKRELAKMEHPETSTITPEPPQKASESQSHTTLLSLRAYILFAEEYILSRYNMFRNATHSSSDRVRFHDLWSLFRPGDLIYMPEKTLTRLLMAILKDKVVPSSRVSNKSTMRQKIWKIRNAWFNPTGPAGPHIPNGSLAVYSYFLDFDGTSYSPVAETFAIPFFEGEKDICTLEFYPLRFAPNASAIMEEHKEIGHKFREYLSERHMRYDGWTLTTDPMGRPITETFDGPRTVEAEVRPDYIDGEVIIDFSETFNQCPNLKSIFVDDEIWSEQRYGCDAATGPDLLTWWSDTGRSRIRYASSDPIVITDKIDSTENQNYISKDRYTGSGRDLSIVPDGDDLALLPRRLFAYSLKSSKFVPIDVRNLKSIEWGEDGFSRLQLQDMHKSVIQSAVRSHLRRRPIERRIESRANGILYTQDFIRGKGRGLIIMLHGEPGIGKTATAEAVAQSFKRPLFPISCGQLNGIYSAERVLDEAFRLADIWECILLIDEADIFLSARTSVDDLERNGLVSIFLRKIEYYNGILFLTTNRIGKIDQAISSRLQLILHYKRLKKPEIENIFRINIERLKQSEKQQSEISGERELVVVDNDVMQFVSDHCAKHPDGKGAWNGRQIRNAFVIAAGMARDEAEQQSTDLQPQLRSSHFKQVERIMNDYVQFRRRVLGKDDAQQALLNEERDDDYEGEEEEHNTHVASPMHLDQRPKTVLPSHRGPYTTSTPMQSHRQDMGISFTSQKYTHVPQAMPQWSMNPAKGYAYGAPPSMPLGRTQGIDPNSFLQQHGGLPANMDATGQRRYNNPQQEPTNYEYDSMRARRRDSVGQGN